MKTMILDTLRSFNRNLRNPMNRAPSPCRSFIILPVLASFAFLLGAHAQLIPPPDGCYPNFTTAEGCNALNFLTTGSGNTGLGWYSLFTGSINTAVGTNTLVFNESGSANTAIGYFALMNNTVGGSNTAIGDSALTANTTGLNNVALGTLPISSNTTGSNNTAIGNLALENSVTTSDHVCVGRHAGDGITIANNNVILGHHNGVHSAFGEVSDRCFIDDISGAPVSAGTAAFVLVDSDGRLGTFTADGPDPGGFSPNGIRPQAVPDAARQAMLNLKVQELEATVAKLTAQLQEQTAQIQKVSAQLELNSSGARTVASDR
jgi:hypothetical protein